MDNNILNYFVRLLFKILQKGQQNLVPMIDCIHLIYLNAHDTQVIAKSD